MRGKIFLKQNFLWGFCFFFLVSCTFKISEKHLSLGTDFESRGQYKRALQEYQKVIKINEKQALVNSAVERSAYINFRHVRDYKKAVQQFEEVYRKSPEGDRKIKAMEMIAEIYLEYLNDTNKSLEWEAKLFNDYGRKVENSDQHYLSYSEKLIEAARYEQAIQLYDDFLKKFPAHPEIARVMIRRGEAYIALGKNKMARGSFQEIVMAFASNTTQAALLAEAYYGLGMTYEREDNLNKALEEYSKALNFYPNREVVEIKIDGIQRRMKLRKMR